MQLKEKIRLVFSDNKWAIYLIGLLIGIAMGIINPLASTHLKANNVGSLWIGVISSSFFLFMAIGSIYIDKKGRNKSIKEGILIGSIISAVAVTIFPFVQNLYASLLLMITIGFGISLNMVGVQTMLQSLIREEIRGMINGLYSLYFAIGFVFSSIIGPMIYEYNFWIPFIIPTITLLLCPIIVKFKFKERLMFPEKAKKNVIKKVSVGLQGAFLYGFTETTLTTLYPIFLLHQNYSLSELGYALGIFVLGSIIGAMPVTYISDRFGRERVLKISILMSIFSVWGIVALDNFALRLFFSFLSGFIIGPIYPISLAVSVQNLSKEEMASGTSLFTSSYGVGSTIGPLISSMVMSLFGDNYIFSVCLILFTIFMFITFIRRSKYKTEVR